MRPAARRGAPLLPRLSFAADRRDELLLRHLAAPSDVELLGTVVELLHRAVLERDGRIPRSGRRLPAALRSAFQTPVPVHRTSGDLLGALGGFAALLGAFFDVLVLALVFSAPGLLRHDPSSTTSGRGPARRRPPAGQRLAVASSLTPVSIRPPSAIEVSFSSALASSSRVSSKSSAASSSSSSSAHDRSVQIGRASCRERV